MGAERTTTGTSSPRLRAAVVATGLVGGAWGLLAALGALEVIGPGPLQPVDGRTGAIIGLAALGLAALALVGALVAVRLPALACALLFVASLGGFLCVGAAWLGPGLVQFAASALALAAIPDPFTQEVAREREVAAHARERRG